MVSRVFGEREDVQSSLSVHIFNGLLPLFAATSDPGLKSNDDFQASSEMVQESNLYMWKELLCSNTRSGWCDDFLCML